MTLKLTEKQYATFLRRAKKNYPNEVFCYLIGTENPEGTFTVDKLEFLPDSNGTENSFEIDIPSFEKLLKKIKKTGKEIIGFLHSHCYSRLEQTQMDNVPSNADYALANYIKHNHDKSFKLIGIVTLHQENTKSKDSLIFYPTQKKIKISWQKN